jgi:sugar phosphate isomerase/epimerase
MADIPIGLQLYSVRKQCAEDLPGTLEAVAEMGYDGVEFAGYYDRTAEELKEMLDDLSLKCCGTHTGADTLLTDKLPETIKFNKTLGNRYLIIPWVKFDTADAWRKFAGQLDDVAKKLQPHKMLTGYHNHAHDFDAIEGTTPWDIVFGNTRKEVVMQVDTGNAFHGGADPVPYIERYPGRAITVHLKEFSKTNPQAALGEGDVPWEKFFKLCETIGRTKWYIVEYEVPGLPPLECVAKCLENLRAMGK